jgi:DNA-binding XRE family transcriptional regulator
MENLMEINVQLLKKLREERAWSQEHLATVSGLSLRTVQRIEAEGKASAESRMAMSAALNIPPSELARTGNGPASSTFIGGPAYGYGGAFLGAACAMLAIYYGGAPQDAGLAVGTVGAVLGVSCAAIGMVAQRNRHRAR